jgi:hypothetical protein
MSDYIPDGPRGTLTLQGHVTLRPEDDEDMWHVYNLIAEVRLENPLNMIAGREGVALIYTGR